MTSYRNRHVPAALLLLLALCAAGAIASSTDDPWSSFRGTAAHSDASQGLLPQGSYGLAVQWTRDIGSGYSAVSISQGRLFTLFTRGENDVVAAFDAESGDEIWSYDLGAKYAGHDGSEDGPLSTPALHDGKLFVVAPNGVVLALDAESGEREWQYELDESNSSRPHYGYTTSPLVRGDTVLVQTGGDGHAVTALDRFTGEPKWMAGDGTATYQTPSMLRLGGRDILVAVGDQLLQGLDAGTGEVLWSLQHSEGQQTEETAHVIDVGNDRFVVDYDRGARLYRATGDGVEEVWTSRAFANSLSIPVLVGDHLYGFTRNILTCADVRTGDIVWRTREVSGQAITRVDDTLAMLSADGALVLAAASADGYEEIARAEVFDNAEAHTPSFAGDAFVVRNREHMASVRVDPDLQPTTAPVEVTENLRGEFGQWIGELQAMPEGRRQAAVDRYWESVEHTPIFEETGNRGLVHFVWRGEAEDVALAGDPVNNQETGLERVDGTDLFFLSLELLPNAQYNYNLSVDYGPPTTDPGNPYSSDRGFVVSSDLRMPDWPASPHLDEPATDAPRGTLDQFQFRSAVLGNTRQIQLWRPADYSANPDRRYPLLVVNHGDNQVRGALMRNTLDNLVGQSVEPLVAVFVPRVQPPEYGGQSADLYNRFLTEELLPHLTRHYRVKDEGAAIMGPGSAGVAAVYAALRYPEVFQGFAAQSFYAISPAQEQIPGLLAENGSKPKKAMIVYSNRDYDIPGTGVAKDASVELLRQIRETDIEAREMVTEYSPDWAGWRGQHDDILEFLFPMTEE